MEMQQIRYFIAVAKELNFTRAAEKCNVSQPSLTRAIKLLETELGGELFRRERNLTHLTNLGKKIHPFLQQSLENAEEVSRLAKAVRSEQVASLCLGLPDGVSLEPFMTHLMHLTQMFAGLDLRVRRGSPSSLTQSLREGEIDLMLGPKPSEHWDRFEHWTLFSRSCGLVFRKGHPMEELQSLCANDLAKADLLHRPYCTVSTGLRNYLVESGYAMPTSPEFARDEDVLLYLSISNAVAVMPTPPEQVWSLVVRPFVGMSLAYNLHATCVSGRQRGTALILFLNQLRAADWLDAAA